jgi:hypothetical protein
VPGAVALLEADQRRARVRKADLRHRLGRQRGERRAGLLLLDAEEHHGAEAGGDRQQRQVESGAAHQRLRRTAQRVTP